ncbi:MAG: inositol monophosphatase [Actinobacteria bacterium]|nr:inositol monophosphatase [Actinomycetota bacterium]MSX14736.1 inositol monophosphatase [Actinomycetota bacterium]MSX35545.1 inositol monophosphatase [Actinomycetota bacterium]MSX76474.1 inositol monophosphatase [Actinomycetota bacterium]MSZ70868.1 inositol monophosphatase [Actinomycetota bacterium]
MARYRRPRFMNDDYVALMNVAARIARNAGDLVFVGRRNGAGNVQTKSSATDMVTQWDTASEQLILKQLGQLRPNDSIVGEEGTQIKGTSPLTWFVDPIDGTTNFLYNLSGYAVSIAACLGTDPVAAAVFLPATRELFVAAKGHGAWLGSTPLHVSNCESIETALIATGFSYNSTRRDAQGQRVARLLPQVRDIRRCGAAAADLCFVACGRIDAYFEEGLQPWDLAAGQLIASEAGATVSNFSGGPIVPSEVLVTTPRIHSSLVSSL